MAHCEHGRQKSTCSMCSPASVFRMYAYRATERGLAFQLNLEQFEQIVRQPCFYCGRTGIPRGIDRVNNSIGYVLFNLVAACGPCNLLKKDLPQFDFLGLVQLIARHQQLKQVPQVSG